MQFKIEIRRIAISHLVIMPVFLNTFMMWQRLTFSDVKVLNRLNQMKKTFKMPLAAFSLFSIEFDS